MATKDDKQLSDSVYETALQSVGAKPTYTGTYENQLSDIYNRIQNREPFQYDVNADPLYQAYKDQYIQGGKLAMKDTMGQAAALTGGYGNTYGQSVGQQAYDAYLQNLSAVIPELYGMAYDQYQDEGDQLNDLFTRTGQMRDAEYGRFRDELGDWEGELERGLQNERYERETARQQEQTDYERLQREEEIARQLENQDYNRRMQEEAVRRQEEETTYQRQQDEYKRQQQEAETAYKRQQQAYANLMAIIQASGYRPTDAELAAAGMTREAADAIAAEYQRNVSLANAELALRQASAAGTRSSGGTTSSGSTRSGGSTYGGSNAVVGIASDSGEVSYVNPYYNPAADMAYTVAARSPVNGSTAINANAGAPVTVNNHGEVRTYDPVSGNPNPTRGETSRAAEAAYRAGQITYSEYQRILRGLH